jgi:hypothetical protein
LLTKEQILAVPDIKTEPVFVDEWGDSVLIKMLTAEQRDEYNEATFKTDGDKVVVDRRNNRAKLVALSLVDEDGNSQFTLDEAVALGKKNSDAIDRIYRAALKLNGMDAKSVEELEKN